MKGLTLKLGALLVGSGLLFACSCPAPRVAEEAKATPQVVTTAAEPECCTKLQNELNDLKLQVESLKSQLENVKVKAEEANQAASRATEAANRAEEAAKKAEAAAAKCERVFEKGLKK